MREKNKIKVPHNIKPKDYKLYISFCMEHVKETDTAEDIERMWKSFKKSLRDAVRGIIAITKELQ